MDGPLWTDALTAIGTVGAVVLALVIAWVTRRDAQRTILQQNERLAAEAQRRFYLETLETVAELYAELKAVLHIPGGTFVTESHIPPGGEARQKLGVFLRVLPDDVATLIRAELEIPNSEAGERKLFDFKSRHWLHGQETGATEAYMELAEDIVRLSRPRDEPPSVPARIRRPAPAWGPRWWWRRWQGFDVANPRP